MRTTTESLPGLTLTNLTLDAPLRHADPSAGTIGVFARVVTGADGERKPYLAFLQGGPGHEAPRPSPGSPPWLARALQDYQVVLLDQRGTGRSTPISTTGTEPLRGLSAGQPAPRESDFVLRRQADARLD